MWPLIRKRNTVEVDSKSMTTVRVRNIQIGNVAGGGLNTFALAVFIYICVSHSLNVGYLILFALSSLIIISSHMGAASLKNLEVGLKSNGPIQAGKIVSQDIKVKSKTRRTDIEVMAITKQFMQTRDLDIEANGAEGQEIQIPLMIPTRGVYKTPEIILQTRKPVGLMRCYIRLVSNEEIFVHPSPEINPPSFMTMGMPEQGSPSERKTTSGQPGGLKNYHPGDPLKLFSWKLFAKTNANILATKTPDTELIESSMHLTLSAATQDGDVEAGLERLTAWIFEAHSMDKPYSMQLNNQVIEAGRGISHLHLCLKELAKFETHA